MYKEYREMSRTEAVDSLYQDMAARHRSRFRSIHVCSTSRSWLYLHAYYSIRSSRLLRLRSPPTSSALTSSNCSRRASASLSLTVFPRHLPRRSSLLTDRRPSRRGVCRRSVVVWLEVDERERNTWWEIHGRGRIIMHEMDHQAYDSF